MGDVPSLILVAFGVGIVIGLTGMGGGALMTPALIFLGIPPTVAVANDLVAAAVNKSVGAAAHLKHGAPNLKLAGLLVIGSVPTAAAGGWIINQMGTPEQQQAFVKTAIGFALLLAACTYVLRTLLNMRHTIRDVATGKDPYRDEHISIRAIPTVVVGALGGLLVGITSVGSGSLIMVALLMLYPRLAPNKLVGTDLVQAVPLVLAAAVGHVLYAGIDWSVLLPLIIGGSPGTYLGARLASWVQQGVVRRGIAVVLSLTGLGILGVPPVWVGIIGAALLVLGPILWGVARRANGLPPFANVTDDDLQIAASRLTTSRKD
ncbi:sulfite exporter TauE/SafE family protein [Janibacter limosus]|uniref:sulfite exporter TauE/SafE family protein n=1 Tax=Janibacter limosus TaxID=53458 RepID=UPI00082D238A|nr:sulfite exporter TauE/SafE family protein [Janibacter limosus]